MNETSSGDGLHRFSKSHYDNTVEAAVTAQRIITLACVATEGPHPIALGAVVIAEPNGRTYRNVEGNGVVYPATLASGGTLSPLFEAEVAGEAANVAPDTVTLMQTTFAGVTVTADAVFRLGIDQESDPRLKLRNTSKWSNLSIELIRDGVIAIALKARPAVTLVDVDDQNPRGAGTFDVYIAGPNATAGPSDIAAVQTALVKRFFGSDRVRTYPAPEVFLHLTGTVYYDSKFALADVKKAVEDPEIGSVPLFLREVPLGGFNFSPGPSHIVPKNDIEAVIKDDTKINDQEVVRTVVLSVPSGDLSVVSFGKVIKGTWSLTYTPVVV